MPNNKEFYGEKAKTFKCKFNQNSIQLEVLMKAKFNKQTQLMFPNIGNDPSSRVAEIPLRKD